MKDQSHEELLHSNYRGKADMKRKMKIAWNLFIDKMGFQKIMGSLHEFRKVFLITTKQ